MAKFTPGQSGNPSGRPKGSRNKLKEVFIDAVLEDFEKHGRAALIACRETKPDVYVSVVGKLMPKEVEVTRTLDELDDDALDAAIATVRALAAAQGAGARARKAPKAKQPVDVPAVPEAG